MRKHSDATFAIVSLLWVCVYRHACVSTYVCAHSLAQCALWCTKCATVFGVSIGFWACGAAARRARVALIKQTGVIDYFILMCAHCLTEHSKLLYAAFRFSLQIVCCSGPFFRSHSLTGFLIQFHWVGFTIACRAAAKQLVTVLWAQCGKIHSLKAVQLECTRNTIYSLIIRMRAR